MLFIKHRVNQPSDLETVDPKWGVEIDLRSDAAGLYLSHDPWTTGPRFEEWLECFKDLGIQGPILLNTKEDGLETRIETELAKKGVENYFFLDTAVPTLIRHTIASGNRHFFVRLSQYEPDACLAAFVEKVEWVWVDCFGGNPLPATLLQKWKNQFKFCLVSPELHGQPLETIQRFGDLYRLADAVCTKQPSEWMKRF